MKYKKDDAFYDKGYNVTFYIIATKEDENFLSSSGYRHIHHVKEESKGKDYFTCNDGDAQGTYETEEFLNSLKRVNDD